MNPLSAMRGTRMGRAVKTPEEVMEELARSREISDTTIENVVESMAVPDQASPLTAGLGDTFSYGSLERLENNDFVLKGLETEEGRWETITLAGDSIVSLAEFTQEQWTNISDGHARLVDGKYEPGFTGRLSNFRLAPMKVVYWFMRAGYEANCKRARGIDLGTTIPNVDVINSLQIFLEASEDKPSWLFADQFSKVDSLIRHRYLGWKYQVFYKKNTLIPKTWTDDHYFLEEDRPIKDVLATLLGDTNPDRIVSVFLWANDRLHGVVSPILGMPVCGNREKTTTVYEVGPGNMITISANCELSTTGPAHMIKIDDNDFTPRKVSP